MTLLSFAMCRGESTENESAMMTPNATALPLPLLCHLSNRNDRGSRAWGGTPDCWPPRAAVPGVSHIGSVATAVVKFLQYLKSQFIWTDCCVDLTVCREMEGTTRRVALNEAHS